MGLCFSRKKTQTTLDPCISLKETQLDSSLSIKEFELIQEEEEDNGIGWFDLPYEMRRMVIDLMDLKTKAIFSKCSIDCYEEVALSRNYIEEIVIDGWFEGHFTINVIKKDDEWQFEIQKSSCGNCELLWNSYPYGLISKTIFKNQDFVEIALKLFNNILKKNTKSLKSVTVTSDDFPYDQTNIKNLRSRTLESLILFKNKHGIDPISSGFVDFDIISRFQDRVAIPNCQLGDLFKMKSETRKLFNPKFSLNDFDDFLRRFFIEEEHDETFEFTDMHLSGIDISTNDLTRVIEKYTGSGVQLSVESESHLSKYVRFWRTSRKWRNRKNCICLQGNSYLFLATVKSN